MTNEQKQDKPSDVKGVEIDVNAIQNRPNYLNGSIEEIEAWVRKAFPPEIQNTILKYIKGQRGRLKKE